MLFSSGTLFSSWDTFTPAGRRLVLVTKDSAANCSPRLSRIAHSPSKIPVSQRQLAPGRLATEFQIVNCFSNTPLRAISFTPFFSLFPGRVIYDLSKSPRSFHGGSCRTCIDYFCGPHFVSISDNRGEAFFAFTERPVSAVVLGYTSSSSSSSSTTTTSARGNCVCRAVRGSRG